MQYEKAQDLDEKVSAIIRKIGLSYIDPGRVKCIRSRGTKTRRTLARVHAISKAVQKGLGIRAHYVIEIITEKFEKLPEEEKTKTLIHELLHIPKSFGGGFRHHKPYVNRKIVERAYQEYLKP